MSKDDGRPIAHVAAEAGVARSTLTKWVHRYRADGIEALEGAEDYGLESIADDLQRHAAHGNVESIDPTEFWAAVQKLRHRT